MNVDLDVLGMVMKYRNSGKSTHTDLSHEIIGTLDREIPSSHNNCLSQITSMKAWVRVRYSDSVLDHDTTICFLDDQETSIFPRKTQYTVINF